MNLTDLVTDVKKAGQEAEEAKLNALEAVGLAAVRYVFEFNNLTWNVSEIDPFILIPQSVHGRGDLPRVFIRSSDNPSAQISVYFTISDNGDITLKTLPGLLFNGKLIIY